MKRPLSPKEEYLARLSQVRKETPEFAQDKGMTPAKVKYVRALMVTYRVSAKEAKQIAKNAKKSRKVRERIATTIKDDSSGRLPTKSPRRISPVSTRPEYKFKGVTINAPSPVVDRYIPDYSTSSRTYTDTTTGESISRRERDKRIAKEVLRGG